jgi:hypothetical protein
MSRLEAWFDRRLGPVVQELAARKSADSEDPFGGTGTVVYRIPLRARVTPIEAVAPSCSHVVRRGLASFVGLGPRLYVADGAPGSLFGKPTALFVFDGLSRRPSISVASEGPFFVGRASYPNFDAEASQRLAVLNADKISLPLGVQPPPQVELLSTSLAGPFPPTDLPNPPKGSPKPTPAPNAPTAGCPPVLLFYGLCFQTPKEGEGSIEDPLSQETSNVSGAFKARGYTVAGGLAGKNAPDGGKAGTFGEMMAGLAKAIAGQTTFCQCPDDQLVIWVAAHGYAGQYNPTGEVAMHYDAKGVDAPKGEWVTWTAFLDALAAIPQVAANPKKVFLIVYSCRSGRIWEGGVIPPTLKGMHVLTGTATSGQYAGQVRFSQYLVFALGWLKAVNWDHLVKLMKEQDADNPAGTAQNGVPFGPPTNGDLAGCRFTMTLSGVTFVGANLGSRWRYVIDAAGLATEIPAHNVTVATGETRNDVVYDRLWGPCPSKVAFSVKCTAVSVGSAYDSDGNATLTVNRLCDGTAQTASCAVAVSATGYGTVNVRLAFVIATTC